MFWQFCGHLIELSYFDQFSSTLQSGDRLSTKIVNRINYISENVHETGFISIKVSLIS